MISGLHRKTSPTARYLALGASVALGAAGLLTFAAPASAHAATVAATSSCDTTKGEYLVNWTVSNDWAGDVTLTTVSAAPTAITNITAGTVVPAKVGSADGKVTGVQRVPGSATTAKLSATAKWTDGYTSTAVRSISLAGTCHSAEPVCVSASNATYSHTFNGAAGTATITMRDLPLCAGQRQDFSLVSYTAPAPGFAVPQHRFDGATGLIDATHHQVTLHVDVPACYNAVYLIWGTDTADTITTANAYSSTRLGGTASPGNRSTGPLGIHSGGTTGCATPTAVLASACDGALTATLTNAPNAVLATQFAVTADNGFSKLVAVKPGQSVTVSVPAADAGHVSVTADGHAVTTGGWTSPTCAAPTVTATAECATMTIHVANPAGNTPLTAIVTTNTGVTKSLTVAAGATGTVSLTASTKLTADVTIGATKTHFAYASPAECDVQVQPSPPVKPSVEPTTPVGVPAGTPVATAPVVNTPPTTPMPTIAQPVTTQPITTQPITTAPVAAINGGSLPVTGQALAPGILTGLGLLGLGVLMLLVSRKRPHRTN
jgi:hypothetical protein